MAIKDVKIYRGEESWMDQQLRKDPFAFFEYMDTFMERVLTASDTNISRQVFLKWNRNGLLPHQSEAESGWRRFSFVEYFWLKIIQKMEEFNISVKAMQRVKQDLFTMDMDLFGDTFYKSINDFEGKEEMFQKLPGDVIQILKDASALKKILSEMAKDITPLMLYFMELLRRRSIAALLIDTEGNCQFVCFNELNEKEKLQKLPLLFSETFVSINLNQLLSDFYISNKVDPEYYKSVELLTDNEIEIINAVRTLGIRELTIKFDKGSDSILIEKVNHKDVKKVQDKVNSLSRKGVVTDIRIVFDEHGTLRLFQEKEQRKINSKSLGKKVK